MVKEEKQENRGSVEFQVFSFTNKIRRLASHLELHKKYFSSERCLRRLLGNAIVTGIVNKILYVIRALGKHD